MAKGARGGRPAITIKVGELAETIAKTLDLFRDDVVAEVNRIAEKVADETVKDLKATSPKRRGKYARGWRKKLAGMGATGTKVFAVHNTTHPGLTHLLEKGHVIAYKTRKGGYVNTGRRTTPIPHIQPAADRATERFLTEVTRRGD